MLGKHYIMKFTPLKGTVTLVEKLRLPLSDTTWGSGRHNVINVTMVQCHECHRTQTTLTAEQLNQTSCGNREQGQNTPYQTVSQLKLPLRDKGLTEVTPQRKRKKDLKATRMKKTDP